MKLFHIKRKKSVVSTFSKWIFLLSCLLCWHRNTWTLTQPSGACHHEAVGDAAELFCWNISVILFRIQSEENAVSYWPDGSERLHLLPPANGVPPEGWCHHLLRVHRVHIQHHQFGVSHAHTHTLTHFSHFTNRFMVHWHSYQQFNDVNKECYYFHNLSDTLTCNLVSFPLCDTFKCLYFIQVFILVQHSLLFVPVRLNGGILSAVDFSPFLNALNPKWWVGFPLGISEPDKGNSRLHHRFISRQLWWEVSCWTLICGSCSVEIRAVRFLQEDMLGITAILTSECLDYWCAQTRRHTLSKK